MENQIEFYPMQQLPKVAKDLLGNEEDFSVTVLVFDKDEPEFCELGFYDFELKEWCVYGELSIDLICWCYPPSPVEFLKDKDFVSVRHHGYRP